MGEKEEIKTRNKSSRPNARQAPGPEGGSVSLDPLAASRLPRPESDDRVFTRRALQVLGPRIAPPLSPLSRWVVPGAASSSPISGCPAPRPFQLRARHPLSGATLSKGRSLSWVFLRRTQSPTYEESVHISRRRPLPGNAPLGQAGRPRFAVAALCLVCSVVFRASIRAV